MAGHVGGRRPIIVPSNQLSTFFYNFSLKYARLRRNYVCWPLAAHVARRERISPGFSRAHSKVLEKCRPQSDPDYQPSIVSYCKRDGAYGANDQFLCQKTKLLTRITRTMKLSKRTHCTPEEMLKILGLLIYI